MKSKSEYFFCFFSLFSHLAEGWALVIISVWQLMKLTEFILLLNNYVDQRNFKKGRFLLRYRMQASSYSTCETKIFLLLLLTNFHQASVVQTLDSSIQWINPYPVDKY